MILTLFKAVALLDPIGDLHCCEDLQLVSSFWFKIEDWKEKEKPFDKVMVFDQEKVRYMLAPKQLFLLTGCLQEKHFCLIVLSTTE